MTLGAAMSIAALSLSVALVSHPSASAFAPACGGPAVGDVAPPITAEAWLNVPASFGPKDLAGKVVLVEFWTTSCGPCVQTMPHVQTMHDRYREKGLVVVALSNEPTSTLEPFLKTNAYTMPVASDPSETCDRAYGITGWPSTFVIGRDGKVAYVGDPTRVEPAIEKTLGLTRDPPQLLTNLFDALRSGIAEEHRVALQRLYEKAPADFALRKWAAERLKRSEDEKAAAAGDAGAALDRIAEAARSRKSADEDVAAGELADHGARTFNLHEWTCRQYGQAFPLDGERMERLLAERRFDNTLAALLDRNPDAAAQAAATRDRALQRFCAENREDFATFARKALMADRFVFGERRPKDDDAFWKELAVGGVEFGGVETSPDGKKVIAILLDGASVGSGEAVYQADRRLRMARIAESLAKGKAPDWSKLAADAAAQAKRIGAELDAKY